MDRDLLELVLSVVMITGLLISSVVGWHLNEKRKEKAHKQLMEQWKIEEEIAKAKGEASPFAPAVAPDEPTAPRLGIPPFTPALVVSSGRKHRIPEDPALAEYMQDLPQIVQNVAGANHLARKLEHEPKIGLWQTSVNTVIGQIKPGELVYAMTWNAHCVTTPTHDDTKSLADNRANNITESHGVVFFSDERFFFYKDPANIVEFPLADIYAVDAHKGHFFDGVSFRTQNFEVQLTFGGKIDRKLFRDMVIHIAADAACPVIEGEVQGDAPQVCECPGCGASVIIHLGAVNKCEYCDRFVEKRAKRAAGTGDAYHERHVPSKPDTATVAEELKKYGDLMNRGVITTEEFEEIKNTLLSRV
ncbi:MAG: SHOCT domain-containing protein [Defluviitaleaceae bacterium]|nr:SHOCT domain-containing protein [Defluviitaleaceae bacterium]